MPIYTAILFDILPDKSEFETDIKLIKRSWIEACMFKLNEFMNDLL